MSQQRSKNSVNRKLIIKVNVELEMERGLTKRGIRRHGEDGQGHYHIDNKVKRSPRTNQQSSQRYGKGRGPVSQGSTCACSMGQIRGAVRRGAVVTVNLQDWTSCKGLHSRTSRTVRQEATLV